VLLLLDELSEELLTEELLLRVDVPLLLLTVELVERVLLLLFRIVVELFSRVFELRTRTVSLFLVCCRVVVLFVEFLTFEFRVLEERVLFIASLDVVPLVEEGLVVVGRVLAISRGVGL
jgi:hypothetical protein